MDKIKEYIEELNFNYSYDEKNNIYRLGFNLPGKLNSCEVIIDATEKFTKFYGLIPISANENIQGEIAEYLTRINYGLLIGNFEMDYTDGEIRYKIVIDNSWGIQINKEIIDDCIGIIVTMFAKYGDGLLEVIFGFAKANEVIERIECN